MSVVPFVREKTPLADKTFLSFSDVKFIPSEVSITFAEAATNVIALGGTGSGKTTGVLMPALYNLMINRCPGLVMDAKNELTSFCIEHAKEDQLYLIGGSNQCSPINILEGITSECFRAFLNDISVIKSDNNNFWGTGAVRDAMLVFYYYKAAYNRTVTLAELYEVIKNPMDFCEELIKWVQAQEKIEEQLLMSLKEVDSSSFSIFALCSVSFERKDFLPIKSEDKTINEQYAWHSQNFIRALSPFATNRLLRDNLSAIEQGAVDFEELIYDRKMVVALDMPAAIYAESAYVVSRLIRDRFYTAVLKTPVSKRKQLGFGVDRYTFMIVDEYQNIMRVASDAASHGLIDDNVWLSQSRGFDHINVFATQGISSLYVNSRKNSEINALLQNIRSSIYLSTSDISTLSYIKSIMPDYEKVVGELLTPKEQGKMLFHKGLCPGACLTTLNTGRSSLPFMNMFIGSQVTERTSYDTYEVMVDNDYVKIEINEPEPEQESLEDTKLSFVDIDDENEKYPESPESFDMKADLNETGDVDVDTHISRAEKVYNQFVSLAESEKDTDDANGSKKDE
jgi:hypothetical protein